MLRITDYYVLPLVTTNNEQLVGVIYEKRKKGKESCSWHHLFFGIEGILFTLLFLSHLHSINRYKRERERERV